MGLVPERIQLRLVSSSRLKSRPRRGRSALLLPASVSPGSFDFQRSAWFKKSSNRLRGQEIYEGQTTQTV